MNVLWYLGLVMFLVAGALLYDVPFIRFFPAMLLIMFGTICGVLGRV
jgi:hypothetical protein